MKQSLRPHICLKILEKKILPAQAKKSLVQVSLTVIWSVSETKKSAVSQIVSPFVKPTWSPKRPKLTKLLYSFQRWSLLTEENRTLKTELFQEKVKVGSFRKMSDKIPFHFQKQKHNFPSPKYKSRSESKNVFSNYTVSEGNTSTCYVNNPQDYFISRKKRQYRLNNTQM